MMDQQSPSQEIQVVQRSRVTSIVRRLAWLNFKLALITWGVVMLLLPPQPVASALGGIIHLVWTGMTILGGVISSIGILLSFSKCPKRYKASIAVELAGLSVLIIGPVIYFITQIGLVGSDPPESIQSRLALVIFAWAMVCALLARIVTVIPRFHKEK